MGLPRFRRSDPHGAGSERRGIRGRGLGVLAVTAWLLTLATWLFAVPASAATVTYASPDGGIWSYTGGTWATELWGGYSAGYIVWLQPTTVESTATLAFSVPTGEEATLTLYGYRDGLACSSARYQVDGGAWTTFSQNGAEMASFPSFTTSSIPEGAHTLTVSNDATSCRIYIDHVVAETSTASTTTTAPASTTTSSTSSTTSSTAPASTTTTTSSPGSPSGTSTIWDDSSTFRLAMLAMFTAGGLMAHLVVPKP